MSFRTDFFPHNLSCAGLVYSRSQRSRVQTRIHTHLESWSSLQRRGFWRGRTVEDLPDFFRLVPDGNDENIPQLSVIGSPPVERGPGLKPHWDSPDDLPVVSADSPLADCWWTQEMCYKASRQTTTCGRLPEEFDAACLVLHRSCEKCLVVWSSDLFGLGKRTRLVALRGTWRTRWQVSTSALPVQNQQAPHMFFLDDIALSGRHLFSLYLKCGRLQSAWEEAAVTSSNIGPNCVYRICV